MKNKKKEICKNNLTFCSQISIKWIMKITYESDYAFEIKKQFSLIFLYNKQKKKWSDKEKRINIHNTKFLRIWNIFLFLKEKITCKREFQ